MPCCTWWGDIMPIDPVTVGVILLSILVWLSKAAEMTIS